MISYQIIALHVITFFSHDVSLTFSFISIELWYTLYLPMFYCQFLTYFLFILCSFLLYFVGDSTLCLKADLMKDGCDSAPKLAPYRISKVFYVTMSYRFLCLYFKQSIINITSQDSVAWDLLTIYRRVK